MNKRKMENDICVQLINNIIRNPDVFSDIYAWCKPCIFRIKATKKTRIALKHYNKAMKVLDMAFDRWRKNNPEQFEREMNEFLENDEEYQAMMQKKKNIENEIQEIEGEIKRIESQLDTIKTSV